MAVVQVAVPVDPAEEVPAEVCDPGTVHLSQIGSSLIFLIIGYCRNNKVIDPRAEWFLPF